MERNSECGPLLLCIRAASLEMRVTRNGLLAPTISHMLLLVLFDSQSCSVTSLFVDPVWSDEVAHASMALSGPLDNVPQLHHAYFTVLESYESCGGTPGPSGA